MLRCILFSVCGLFTQWVGAASAAITLHMIGDSTMADKPVWPAQPERGWGQLLPMYATPSLTIKNYAVNGRSTKSFINEGRWDAVKASIKPGDFLIIQFGHNDEKQDKPAVYAAAEGAYRENLRRFVRECRSAGGYPILATPIARRRFSEEGKLVDTHGAYPAAVRTVAGEENVPLIDLTVSSSELLTRYGPERSKQLFLWIQPGEYDSLPTGKQDDTHLSAVGASRMAELAILSLVEVEPALAQRFRIQVAEPTAR
jgi:lysophospholipase L1-like esterase